MNDDAVYDVADAVLDAVALGLIALGIEVPARQYVHAGNVALDCEQLVVSGVRLYSGLPNAEDTGRIKCATPRGAQFDVWIIRCVPGPQDNGSAPSAADLSASAAVILRDAWVLPRIIRAAYVAGDLLPNCDDLAITGVDTTAAGPEGGYGGTHMILSAQITETNAP